MPARNLFIVRIALMAGVFFFAGVAMWRRTQNPGQAAALGDAMPTELMRYALWGLAAAAILAALYLRPRAEAAEPAKRALMLLMGWTFGEGVALLGIVLHFVGAPIATLAVGLLAFIVTLLLLPVPVEPR